MMRAALALLAAASALNCGRINYQTVGQTDGSTDGPVGVAGIATDYFSECGIDTDVWELVDPLGDGGFSTTGQSFDISINGTNMGHDVWSFPGDPDSFLYTVARAMQKVPDADFEVEAKYDSSVSVEFQQQGILIEQDLENVIRVEFHSEGVSTRLFIAFVVDRATTTVLSAAVESPGTAPMWLRVRRSGSRWDITHSFDGDSFVQLPGASFDQDYQVASLGVFAGNGPLVGHTAVIDHFRNLAVPFDSVAAMPGDCQ